MTPSFKDNNLLAQQLRSGNTKAYDFLMDTYYKSLCIYAYSLTKDYDNAEDIVQNVFVEIWINRKNIKPELSIKSYLYRSVYNKFIDFCRKNKPVIFLEKKVLEAIDSIVENEEQDLGESIKLIYSEIEKLPSKCKEIFLLNKREGLTHVEISEHLDISLKTVEGHITRAFKILKQKLGNKMKPVFFLLFDLHPTIKQST